MWFLPSLKSTILISEEIFGVFGDVVQRSEFPGPTFVTGMFKDGTYVPPNPSPENENVINFEINTANQTLP